jgi:hypothetical protein
LPAGPADGVVPFLIDWGTTAHPSSGPLPVLPLLSLAAEHPDPGRVRDRLAALDVDLPVRTGAEARLVVQLRGADGEVVLT